MISLQNYPWWVNNRQAISQHFFSKWPLMVTRRQHFAFFLQNSNQGSTFSSRFLSFFSKWPSKVNMSIFSWFFQEGWQEWTFLKLFLWNIFFHFRAIWDLFFRKVSAVTQMVPLHQISLSSDHTSVSHFVQS